MADIDYSYKDSIHTIGAYDDVLKTYNWICNAMSTVFKDRENLSFKCNIAFSSDEMSFECHSLNEFKKYAFGKNIEVKRLLIYVYEDRVGSLVGVFATYHEGEEQKFVISSKDEMLIINLRDALMTNNNAKTQQKENIVMKYEDNSVHIGDNNQISNSVVGVQNTADVKQKTEVLENKKESFLSKTFWNFFIPILGAIIAAILLAWFGLK